MFWILIAILVISVGAGIVLPALAVVFFKICASVSGKKITCRQIFDMIGY